MYNRSLFLVSCILLVAVASSQYCNWNEVEVECVNECNTCGQRTVCVTDCTPGCDCIPGFYRNWYGICIPERYCGPAPIDDGGVVADDGGCPRQFLCQRSCRRRGLPGGRCVGRRRRTCRCG
ncbi:hypothetical protein JTE90_021036 [Oedothorax gibbosus]|uniref:TIL domain-containing protein n=1 Tax=Oedothorax gibbosus TaxID=931172 RepID=A0AAV6VTE7_9ARAC|nr:hypothetical protein JTE90_001096 [Oedothorax gibbosus]KAG8189639.1 hypothetical protein JTE90_018488 [Oedothorax gibbosus]KAG8199021.1 hypothetical protein JTE90_021036 [Oedothorax gibbosus]